MRSHLPWLSLGILMLVASPAKGQLAVRPASGPPGEAVDACVPDRKPCVFTDLQGENTYTVDKNSLARDNAGKRVFNVAIAGKDSVKVLMASISKTRAQLAIAFEQVTVPTGAMFSPELMSSDQVHRAHWLSIRNPKTGEDIKSIDLGMFRPVALGMTASGDYIWIAGDELQLRRREIRAYNARSGKAEFAGAVDARAALRLYERGFLAGAVYYVGENAPAGAVRKHNSPNAYSVAEFTVRKTGGLSTAALNNPVVAVVGFQGGTPELKDMLESALAIKMSGAGFKVVERQRLKDLLQEARFQNLGLTDASKAVELGRLLNAQQMLFGQLQTTGNVSSIALRLVGVANGAVTSGIELECRDCTPDDYLQGLTFLIGDWVEGSH